MPERAHDDAIDLTIDIWDPKTADEVTQPSGDLESWYQHVAASKDGRYFAHYLPNTRSCLDRSRNRVVATIDWHRRVFVYERGKPFTLPLLQWLGDTGLPVVHAGLVARNKRGVLLVGRSGVGKTTLTLRCLRAGFEFIGEDYVVLEGSGDGGTLGHSLYGSAFLAADHLSGLGMPASIIYPGRDSLEKKSLALLGEAFSGQLKPTASVSALVLPRISEIRGTRMTPVTKGQALMELAKGSMLEIPNVGLRVFDGIVKLVERVPCYRLEYGYSAEEGPTALDDVLDRLQ